MPEGTGASPTPQIGDFVIVSTHARQYRVWLVGIHPDQNYFHGYECEPGTTRLKWGEGGRGLIRAEGRASDIIEVDMRARRAGIVAS